MKSLLHFPLPIILLIVVFVAIAVRKVGRLRLPIWLVMISAAVIVLLAQAISVKQAYHAISFDVLIYLFGVFVIGQALESSHYLENISFRIFYRARSLHSLLFIMIVLFAFSSALLMNDTIAIIGTPVILLLARQHQFNTKPFLLVLAYSITLGSVMSPIGNPQNLLIANSGMSNPFVSFLSHLLLPTVINLLVLYGFIWLFFRRQLQQKLEPIKSDTVVDTKLARLSKISVSLLVILIILKIILTSIGSRWQINFSILAIISCAPILLFSNRRLTILRHLDWHSLIFFVGLFIFMESVWLSGYFQTFIKESHIVVTHKGAIFIISIVLSQFISNVPLVALYLPLLKHAHVSQLLALAAGSTVAGNLLILGAASNIIVIQNAEKRKVHAFSFWDFFKIGLPLTVVNTLIYYYMIGVN